jgi:flagellar biosynthetic protein FliP
MRFLLHLGEMSLAMMLGMYLLAMPCGMIVAAIGFSGPIVSALVMTFNMTAPMVLWMRFRGHTWERSGEMGAAMVIPTIALVVVSLFGVIPQDGLANAVMIPMFPAMVAAMLYRRADYAHCGGHRPVAPSIR